MPSNESAHMHFLTEAAQWLESRSPSTSAHLLAVHTQIQHNELKPLNAHQKKHHCACGMLRSKPTQVTKLQSKEQSKGQGKPISLMGSALVYKCRHCRQRSILPRKRPMAKSSRNSRPLISSSPSVSTTEVSTTEVTSPVATATTLTGTSTQPNLSTNSSSKPTDNANSKKRAKTRKQGGLQALLASKQKSQPSLDLFDFLQ